MRTTRRAYSKSFEAQVLARRQRRTMDWAADKLEKLDELLRRVDPDTVFLTYLPCPGDPSEDVEVQLPIANIYGTVRSAIEALRQDAPRLSE